MKKIVLTAMLLLAAWCAFAITATEFLKAQMSLRYSRDDSDPGGRDAVKEKMAPFMARLKARKMTAEAVGDKAMEFARKSNSASEPFFFRKGAVACYVRGKAYGKAADALEDILYSHGVPHSVEYMQDLLKAVPIAAAQADSRLSGLRKEVCTRLEAGKRIQDLAARLKANPDDTESWRRFGELIAASGNVSDARTILTMVCGMKNDNADFWWNYEPLERTAEGAFREYAAGNYLAAIVNKRLPDKEKDIAGQRARQGLAGISRRAARNGLESRLKAIRLEAISFNSPDTIADVAERLNVAAGFFEAPALPPAERRIRFAAKDCGAVTVPRISVGNCSLWEILAIVCKHAHCDCVVEGKSAVITIIKAGEAIPAGAWRLDFPKEETF
ncbi:MAG: hypothetical protein IJ802_01695 [Kiritimatiellae bacterium]|nr:hypothetical protein [Kiritimatiellia bacterium]